MAASLSDILSALKNGVIAINNLASAYSYSLISQSALTTTTNVIYTAGSSSTVYLNDICFCNTTGSAVSVNLYLVPTNSAVGTGNALFYGLSIPANTTYHWTGTQVLNSGGTIQASASAAGCTLMISGRVA